MDQVSQDDSRVFNDGVIADKSPYHAPFTDHDAIIYLSMVVDFAFPADCGTGANPDAMADPRIGIYG